MVRYILPALTAAVLLVPAAFGGDDAKDKKKKKGPDSEAIFAKLDADKDGKLSASEFEGAMAELRKKADGTEPKKPAKAGGKRASELFTKLDADKNGSLSKDEFKKMQDVMKELREKKKDK